MKHDWKRDDNGKIAQFGDEWPYAECRICGTDSNYYRPEAPELDGEECAGLDLTVTVTVFISHPGKAGEYDDSASVSMKADVPLSALLSADHDLVLKALGDAVEVISGSWRGARTAHESAWRAAVSADASSPDTEKESN